MLYFYKSAALALLPPGIFVLVLIVLAAYMFVCRLRGRWVAAYCAVLLYLLSLPVVAVVLLHPLENAYEPEYAQADAVIVLGGGAVQGTPGVNGSGTLGAYSASRLLTAMQLARKENLPVMVTGGQVFSDTGNEGQIAAGVLRNMGFDGDKIIIEDKARNTRENAENTLALCQARGIKSVYLVTSAVHMPRSMTNFEAVYSGSGIKIMPYPCDYLISRNAKFSYFSLLPQMWALEANYMALHEYLGLAALKIL